MSEVVVRRLPTDPKDMVPSAVRWAYAALEVVRLVPTARMRRTFSPLLQAVAWVLAAAADYDDLIPADHTAEVLAGGAASVTGRGRSASHGSVRTGGCSTGPVRSGTGGCSPRR